MIFPLCSSSCVLLCFHFTENQETTPMCRFWSIAKHRLRIQSKTAFSALVSERTFHGKAACEKAGVRPIPFWWRWRESTRGLKNSPPDCFSRTAVRRPVRLLALKAQTAPAPSGDDGAGGAWWRWRESNPRPKTRSRSFLRA